MDVSLMFLFQNIIVLSFVFWALSCSSKKTFKLKKYKHDLELFECGFFSSNRFNMHFNLHFLFIVWLLIIYDVEFFFLIPHIFNWSYVTPQFLLIYGFFLSSVIITLLYDYQVIYLNYYC